MKLLVADPIWAEAVEQLRSQHDVTFRAGESDDLVDLVQDQQVIVMRSGVQLTKEVIEAAPGLELIVRAGSGLDNIDLEAAKARGIRIARVPGASPEAVAELALGLMLAATRNISWADTLVREGRWLKHQLGGSLIRGKTLGIIGAGRIGRRTGAIGAALGMRVLVCVAHPSTARAAGFAAEGMTLCDVDTVIAEADFLSIHTPLHDTTRHLIDETAIGKMKPGSVLINTARGGVVDEAAVFDALQREHLSAAAFDVHESEGAGVVPTLAQLPNVVLTPHIGGMAHETQRWIGMRVVEIIDAYVDRRLDDLLEPEERVL
jgi:phosphoglycerate dehydrogenase-like enzyme